MLHVRLQPGTRAVFSVAAGSNVIVHAIDGSASVDGAHVNRHQVALLESTVGAIAVQAGDTGFDALLISGMPLHEPVSRYGPFMMNTHDEIAQAVADLQAGRFG